MSTDVFGRELNQPTQITPTSIDTSNFLQRTGGVMGGDIDMNDNKITNLRQPSSSNDAVNKQFLDNFKLKQDNINIYKNFDVNHKAIINLAKPSSSNDAATKKYVDDTRHIATANFNMNNNRIISLANPLELHEATNKRYVDDELSAKTELISSLTSNANNITSGTLNKDRLPSTFNLLDLDNNRITNLGNPTSLTDAVNRRYLENTFIISQDNINISKSFDMHVQRITNVQIPTDDNDAANKKYVDSKSFTITKDLDLKENKIINLSQPINDTDAVNKLYLDKRLETIKRLLRYDDYKKIKDLKPKFWISQYYHKEFSETFKPLDSSNSITDISGESGSAHEGGLTKTGTITRNSSGFNFTATNRVTSAFDFNLDTYTFFLLAKRKNTTDSARLFTSSEGNVLFGYWSTYMDCLWINSNVYGVSSNKTDATTDLKLYILVCVEGKKFFYDFNSNIIISDDGDNKWGGKVVIGQSPIYPDEGGDFYVQEVLCFDTDMSAHVTTIRNIFNKYYDIVK